MVLCAEELGEPDVSLGTELAELGKEKTARLVAVIRERLGKNVKVERHTTVHDLATQLAGCIPPATPEKKTEKSTPTALETGNDAEKSKSRHCITRTACFATLCGEGAKVTLCGKVATALPFWTFSR